MPLAALLSSSRHAAPPSAILGAGSKPSAALAMPLLRRASACWPLPQAWNMAEMRQTARSGTFVNQNLGLTL